MARAEARYLQRQVAAFRDARGVLGRHVRLAGTNCNVESSER